MASLTASHLVSHVQGGGVASSADSMPNMVQIGQRTPLVTHNGLRSLNRANTLQMRNNVRSIATRWSKSPGKIICGSSGMNLVFVLAECGPWSKTGGLGDVVGGLPPALAGNGHRVMTVSPRYDQYKDAWDTSVIVEIQVGESVETVRFYHCYKRGVDRVFIDHPIFLEKVWGKTKSKIYGPDAGVDYDDNQLRFSLLCSAALEAPRSWI